MEVKRMADTKTTIYYNHNFYYDFPKLSALTTEDSSSATAAMNGSTFSMVIHLPCPIILTACTVR